MTPLSTLERNTLFQAQLQLQNLRQDMAPPYRLTLPFPDDNLNSTPLQTQISEYSLHPICPPITYTVKQPGLVWKINWNLHPSRMLDLRKPGIGLHSNLQTLNFQHSDVAFDISFFAPTHNLSTPLKNSRSLSN